MTNYLNEYFYLGGYFIIKPITRAEWMNHDVLPESLLSASSCICDFYPDSSVVFNKSRKKKKEYRKEIGVDFSDYNKMEDWLNKESENRFEYPNFFSSLNSANEFCQKFLYNQSDLRIIGVALPKICRDAFLEEQDDLGYGICKNIHNAMTIDLHSKILGYEILGYEHGGFHSYICNGLENQYKNKFDYSLNENGFIETLKEAQMLANYTNEEVKDAEPVKWFPWAILGA
ncbi:MAG: hypothetical protein H2184_12680 [Candidatus Galacturonibacter soehngenii]|nr:hypothetical protein [Candidatus Galacturonibacter soehngenii]